MLTVTLKDGSVIDGVTLNGTTYYLESEADASLFTDDNFSSFTVLNSETGEETAYEDMNYYAPKYNEREKKWYFSFWEKSAQEKKEAETATYITNIEKALVELYEASLEG